MTSPQPQSNNNKRKHSESSASSIEASEEADNDTTIKRQQVVVEIAASPSINNNNNNTNINAPPPMVALPPPLMQYPNGQLVSLLHHHPQQKPYCQIYHHHPQQQPFYYPISPQQHPFITQQQSPVLIPQEFNSSSGRKLSTPRILPKNPDTTIIQSPLLSQAGALYPQLPLSPFYHPYTLQMSPTMMLTYPTPNSTSHHDSISPGLGPTSPMNNTNSTADQREKARKVSHSAIERRRRERINDKILQLKQLIPSCVEQDNLHKMSILQSAIDYIAYLKDIVKSFDENGTELTTNQLLKGDHLRVKMAKSMLPKEVEPFTTQFSVHTKLSLSAISKDVVVEDKSGNSSSTDQQRRSVMVEHNKRGLKPMDVIKSGTPTPLTPPQDASTDLTNTCSPSPILLSFLPSTPLLKPDETKHMSLQNILC